MIADWQGVSKSSYDQDPKLNIAATHLYSKDTNP